MLTPEAIIQHFNMQVLPVEGGVFTQTYRAAETIPHAHLPDRYPEAKPFGTAIVYLYTDDPNMFSAMHTLRTDETFHFYMGDPVEMLHLHPDGRTERVILGHDILNGQKIQHTVSRGVWQGSYLKPGGQWALVGTTMAPGWTDTDYIGGERDALITQYPNEADLITRLTRPDAPLTMPKGV